MSHLIAETKLERDFVSRMVLERRKIRFMALCLIVGAGAHTIVALRLCRTVLFLNIYVKGIPVRKVYEHYGKYENDSI